MLDTAKFGKKLKDFGFSFYSGVPCSFLKNLINYAINDCEYVMAANEGDAVAISSGAHLAGRKSVVMMQNSGLTNAVSPLTSLNYTFQIPVLGFVSLRGEDGIGDEPQHDLMGPITTKMLELMEVEWEFLSNDNDEAEKQIERANKIIEQNKTFFFVVKKGTLDDVKLNEITPVEISNDKKAVKEKSDEMPTRLAALTAISELKDESMVCLAPTGKSGRELYEIEDSPSNLYMVGSMGAVSSIGLGISLAQDKKSVVAIDGDGALLMRMGSLATNAYYTRSNMIHILLDNNTHDSTGGQFTLSGNIDFVNIAASTGYKNAVYAHSIEELKKYFENWKRNKELTFIHLKVSKGSKKNLGRPTIKPYQVKERLMSFISGT